MPSISILTVIGVHYLTSNLPIDGSQYTPIFHNIFGVMSSTTRPRGTGGQFTFSQQQYVVTHQPLRTWGQPKLPTLGTQYPIREEFTQLLPNTPTSNLYTGVAYLGGMTN